MLQDFTDCYFKIGWIFIMFVGFSYGMIAGKNHHKLSTVIIVIIIYLLCVIPLALVHLKYIKI